MTRVPASPFLARASERRAWPARRPRTRRSCPHHRTLGVAARRPSAAASRASRERTGSWPKGRGFCQLGSPDVAAPRGGAAREEVRLKGTARVGGAAGCASRPPGATPAPQGHPEPLLRPRAPGPGRAAAGPAEGEWAPPGVVAGRGAGRRRPVIGRGRRECRTLSGRGRPYLLAPPGAEQNGRRAGVRGGAFCVQRAPSSGGKMLTLLKFF